MDDLNRLSLDWLPRRTDAVPAQSGRRPVPLFDEILHCHLEHGIAAPGNSYDPRKAV
jgi:hypothetical protein